MKSIASATLAILLIAMAATHLARASEFETVTFASSDLENTPIAGYLVRPEGRGPFPAVVALHGCSGLFSKSGERFSARHRDWAERFALAGYAVLFPDSYGSRGLDAQCNVKGRDITPKDRALDVKGAAEWLSRQRDIDAKRLALIGWSNGGSTVLWSMDPELKPDGRDFLVAFAFYPGCRIPLEKTAWHPRLQANILIGNADDWTPAAPCRELASRWGSSFQGFDGAYHDFDTPDLEVREKTGVAYSASGNGIVHTGTNPAARQAAIDFVMTALKSAFGTAAP